MEKDNTSFQTPSAICDYMVAQLYNTPNVNGKIILEPTPGNGNLVESIKKFKLTPIIPINDFWEMEHNNIYDGVVMNPPFSPPAEAWRYLSACMVLSNTIIALVPWLILINGDKRYRTIINYGLKSVTHLPRSTFPKSRIQCCVLHMEKNYHGIIEFKKLA